MSTSSLVAAATASLVLLTGCHDSADSAGSSDRSSASPTGLDRMDTLALPVERAAFCGQLERGAPARALGGEVADATEYAPGDTVEVIEGEEAVSHEWSCTYASDAGVEARAWLFAPPITRDRGRALARDARVEGCRPVQQRVEFGRGSVGLVCDDLRGRTVSWRGLFGDAWLACSVRAPRETRVVELADRTQLWCAEVARAASR